MRITAIHEQTIPLSADARSANISFDAMTASVVAIHTDVRKNGKSLVGLAFDTIGRYGHGGLLRERFIPRLMAADPASYADGDNIDPTKAWNVVMANEKFGGHGERCGAVGLIDAALWDIAAKLEDMPLWYLLASRNGKPDSAAKIPVYASGGHYRSANDAALLRDEIRQAMDAGNIRFKIKIGGADLKTDLGRIETVLTVLAPGMSLAVDANGTFDLDTAEAYLNELPRDAIAWLEEPASALDYELNREIAALSSLPIATGENLFSYDDARNLLRYGGLRGDRDMLQFDILASYGLVEYERILTEYAANGWSRGRFAPHAGHLFAMNAVGGLGLGLAEIAMGTASTFGQMTASVPVSGGLATLPDAAGVGFEQLSIFDQIFGGVLRH